MKAGRRGPALSRRTAAIGGAAALLTFAFAQRAAAGPLLPSPASLAAEVAAAARRRRALAIMFGLEGCPWCKLVREAYLVPLRAEGQPVVELDLRGAAPVLDFDARAATHAAVARALQVRVAPTVLFVGPGGREVAERLPGVPLPDFYGAYLQQRLDAANRALA